jgi:SAM-dependent methyltransferase
MKGNRQNEHYEQIGVAMTCRSYEEYVRMFALTDETLTRGKVLDAAAGASSFAAEARRRGADVVCADPKYAQTAAELEANGLREIEESTAKLGRLADRLDWSYYGSLERHKAGRIRSLRLFLQDFREQADKGRYLAETLPVLGFADHSFSLVLCSHFLFLYEEQFDYAFHCAALEELIRVCKPGGEIRVYPLASLRWEPYTRLGDLVNHLESKTGAICEFLPSSLPFIPNSNRLLRIQKR